MILLAADKALTHNSEAKVFAFISTILFSSQWFKEMVSASIFAFLPFEVFIILFVVFLYVCHIFVVQRLFGANYF